MKIHKSLTRAPQLLYFLFIFSFISGGCNSNKDQTPSVSNQLTSLENRIVQEDSIEIAKSIRATVRGDPCIEDIVLGLPEENWRCSTPEPGEQSIQPEITTVEPTPRILNTPEELPPDTETIQWDQAYTFIDQYVNVCGPVVDSYFAASTDGQPTFLNLGKEYPDPERFTVLIWGSNLESFPFNPDEYYFGKTICIRGKIVEYEGIYEIEARKPDQIEVR